MLKLNATHQRMQKEYMSDENSAPESDVSADDLSTQDVGAPDQSQSVVETQKAIEKLEREYSLKVNGKDVKAKVDLNDTARITKALQMEAAAQEAFRDRAITAKQLQEIQQDVQNFLSEFSADPLKVLMNGDFNFTKEQKRAIAEAILREDLEESQKTPEQIRAEQAEERLQELMEEKEALEAQRRSEEQSYLEQQAAIELETEISDAITAGELPKSKYMAKKLADLAYIAYMNGVDLSMKEIIPFAKEQYKKDMREMLQVLKDEEVEELVSKERIRNIRNKQIQSVKPKGGVVTNPLKTQDTGAGGKKSEEAKPIRAKDFFRNLAG
jgi:hypothetical protein